METKYYAEKKEKTTSKARRNRGYLAKLKGKERKARGKEKKSDPP